MQSNKKKLNTVQCSKKFHSSSLPFVCSHHGNGSKNYDGFDESLFHDLTSSMYDPSLHLPNKPDFNNPQLNYESATPLGDELMKFIGVTGIPITFANYMHFCLRHKRFGYYTRIYESRDGNNVEFSSDSEKEKEKVPCDSIDDDYPSSFSYKHRIQNQRRIGAHNGDFTTAPEISQLFGECLTIWLLTQYEMLGKPSEIQLVEVGPGNGTLISDVIRSAVGHRDVGEEFVRALFNYSSNRKDGKKNSEEDVIGLHLVEVSHPLRFKQKQSLQFLVLDLSRKEIDKEEHENNVIFDFNFVKWKNQIDPEQKLESSTSKFNNTTNGNVVNIKSHNAPLFTTVPKNLIRVQWHDNLSAVPVSTRLEPVPVFFLCQEFLDALPVHIFQMTKNGWRERMVDVAIREEDMSSSFEMNGIKNEMTHIRMLDGTTHTINQGSTYSSDYLHERIVRKQQRFRFILSPNFTSAGQAYIDGNNLECIVTNSHKSEVDAKNEKRKSSILETKQSSVVPVGTVMEVCPEAITFVKDITARIEKSTGAALIIDYGYSDFISRGKTVIRNNLIMNNGDTVRAFRHHKQCHVLSYPGLVDLTADVNFNALRYAVSNVNIDNHCGSNINKNKCAVAFGPITQGEFMLAMGVIHRVEQLIDDENTTDEQAEELYIALERLVSPEKMGKRYKVMSIVTTNNGFYPDSCFHH